MAAPYITCRFLSKFASSINIRGFNFTRQGHSSSAALKVATGSNRKYFKQLAVGSAAIFGIFASLKAKSKEHSLDSEIELQSCETIRSQRQFQWPKNGSLFQVNASEKVSEDTDPMVSQRVRPVTLNRSANALDLPWHLQNPPTKQVRHNKDDSTANLTLYQYTNCPFCCKVRAYLDFYGINYDIVEVDSIRRTQKKWTSYKKVPLLVWNDADSDGFLQLIDSSVIVSILESDRVAKSNFKSSPKSKPNIEKLISFYPSIEYRDGRKTVHEFPNKYFIMFEDGEMKWDLSALREEREWREWVDNNLVHILSPNAYRTLPEAIQSFKWFSEAGNWENAMSSWSRLVCIYAGAFVMWAIGGRLKRKYGLDDDVRQSLYKAANDWLEGIGPDRKFMGGDNPNLADLAVFGVISSIEGCHAFNDLSNNTQLMKWYTPMKRSVQTHCGANRENSKSLATT